MSAAPRGPWLSAPVFLRCRRRYGDGRALCVEHLAYVSIGMVPSNIFILVDRPADGHVCARVQPFRGGRNGKNG